MHQSIYIKAYDLKRCAVLWRYIKFIFRLFLVVSDENLIIFLVTLSNSLTRKSNCIGSFVKSFSLFILTLHISITFPDA